LQRHILAGCECRGGGGGRQGRCSGDSRHHSEARGGERGGG